MYVAFGFRSETVFFAIGNSGYSIFTELYIYFYADFFNATKYNCWDMSRAHFLVYESLLDDEMDQMCGFTHVGDGGGVTSAHVTSWSPSDFARLLKWGEVMIIYHIHLIQSLLSIVMKNYR